MTAPNANCKAYDQMAKAAWINHGLMTIHIQDGRIPQWIRDLLIKRFTLKHGARV